MLRTIATTLFTLSIGTMAVAQSGEDHSAKSDVTNRAGEGTSTGGPSRDPGTGADPNVVTSHSTVGSPAVAPTGNAGHVHAHKVDQRRAKAIQARQKASSKGKTAQ